MKLINIVLEQSDSEVKRRVIKGFKLAPAPEGFDEPYILNTGKNPDPHMAKRINKWISVNFPFSNVKFKYEKGYRTINYILPVDNQTSLFEYHDEDPEYYKGRALTDKEAKSIEQMNKDAKFITCRNCRHKFTQTTYKKKKSLPICPTCGTHNK
jgi:uncharacterized CHY-type Zn-finger protein